VLLVSSAMRCNNKYKRILLVRFGFVVAGLALVNAFALHFAFRNILAGPYFLLLYFGSDLVLIFLVKAYLKRNAGEFSYITDPLESLYQKYGISKREREIISGICKGKTNQEIANELFISLQTVIDHTYNIFRIVNVRNRVQLAHIFSKHNK
jgi:DNA-binding CsgD family transcriptional regulator